MAAGQMTQGAFKASLALLALEAERLPPSAILIDATQFQHRSGPGVMEWRNDCIIPCYGSAGVQKFGFHVPAGFPGTIEEGGKEVVDGPAIFPTAWFSESRHRVAQQFIAALKQSAWRRYRAARSVCALIQSPSVRPNNRPRPRAER